MEHFWLRSLFTHFLAFFGGMAVANWELHKNINLPIYRRLEILPTEMPDLKVNQSEIHNISHTNITLSDPTGHLIAALSHLSKAQRQIGNNTADRLITTVMNDIHSRTKQFLTKQPETIDVCPENCSNAPKFTDIITILLDTVYNSDTKDLKNIMAGIRESYAGVRVIISTLAKNSSTVNQIFKSYQNYSVLIVNEDYAEGQIWSDLVKKSSTKYVFVGRKLTNFLSDSRLERLVRLLNYVGAEIVGGAIRDPQGHWHSGCFQSSMRNFAYRLTDGYDLSFNSCLFCDYLAGPFASRPQLVGELLKGAEALSGQILFADLFAKLRYGRDQNAKILSCPDSLHFTNGHLNISKVDRDDWIPFAQRWELTKIHLPTGQKFNYDCDEVNLNCTWLKGIAMPPCCLEEISFNLRLLMQICEEINVGCELEGGSTVGSLKFGSILPWERDGDMNWRTDGYMRLLNQTGRFRSKNLRLKDESDISVFECVNMPNISQCGYFALRSDNFRMQLYGEKQIAQSYLDQRGIFTPTKSLLDGVWVNVYPNPAASARNQYGDDLFEHVEHWITLGSSDMWHEYTSGSFLPCLRPGFHGCLDQFFPSGNLQFRESLC